MRSEQQEPIVQRGTVLTIGDHKATVVGVRRDGVAVTVAGRGDQVFVIPREQIETAIFGTK